MSTYSDPYAVKLTSGVLITCDSAAKQILLHIDSQRDGPSKFILRDIDETHVLVKKEHIEIMKDLLQVEVSFLS
ncbi:hypothetical protein TREMEDRAFT_29558 [Tremella mesenterica DSM 1558]|uniref:uncharacterized protein n=1 Tax=Tremella mesenterica (strain ATCC 24925 / CBS 8224 / DSM 1558 / NBRC 9311 / NRRL Y-6157 / RJB 2259-6 / UBC 559-6) TaxID=578456 RepID=UPI0003F496D3|nr:uncharacterized protein TREMEDRAFT_29558 [Tremella mesenterica DSM 1558]EIW69931.1 hypothetical protein TREMEDRAFT_29558 [Tremella mesenterica DSM 1558]